jgi:GAF domain-containing protein
MQRANARDGSTSASTLADLDRKLASVPDAVMRFALVREWAEAQCPERIFEILTAVLRRRPPGQSSFDALREALHGVLLEHAAEPLSSAARCALYALALDAGDSEICRMLRPADPARTCEEPAAGLTRDLAELPLGRRRSLARSADRALLQKLARDPDPIVIDHLLQNPRTRESDVARMAALRPVAAGALGAIHASARWSGCTAVRLALARNPYTPVEIALKVQNGLPLAELREIASDSALHPDVRAQARSEITRRGH